MPIHIRSRKRFSGVTFLHLLVTSTLISTPIITRAGGPEDITAEEMMLIPRYCSYAQGFPNHGHPEARNWAARLGQESFHDIHHYCWGRINLLRATRSSTPRQLRDHLLATVISDYVYVIRNAERGYKNFVLLPEILTGKGQAELLLSRVQDANKSFAQARTMNPEYWPAYSAWAEFLMYAGKKAEARMLVKSGLEFSPNARTLRELYRLLGGDPSAIVPKIKPIGPEGSAAITELPSLVEGASPANGATKSPLGGSVAR